MGGYEFMSTLYENLLRATDNTDDITHEKYATITSINENQCTVKETETGLEHTNVPILNGASLQTGDKVIIGFLNNNIYDVVCYGKIDGKTTEKVDWSNITNKPTTYPPNTHTHTSNQITDLINTIYPVGSIYISTNSTSPSTLFGGTWEQIKDTFLLASGDSYENGSTGGSADAVIVEHRHDMLGTKTAGISSGDYLRAGYGSTSASQYTDYTGESGVGKNMPPYLAVYMWKRTG